MSIGLSEGGPKKQHYSAKNWAFRLLAGRCKFKPPTHTPQPLAMKEVMFSIQNKHLLFSLLDTSLLQTLGKDEWRQEEQKMEDKNLKSQVFISKTILRAITKVRGWNTFPVRQG